MAILLNLVKSCQILLNLMKTTISPYCHFGMIDQGLPAARLNARHRTTVRNVKISLFEKIVLLLHPHVDVPYSLVVA